MATRILPVFLLCLFSASIGLAQQTGKNSLTYFKLKAGDLSPNVKYIDADELSPFCGGAAIVKKGIATALIDSNGNFVIPFNKYKIDIKKFSGKLNDYKTSGIFFISDASQIGAVNASGKLIANAPGYQQKKYVASDFLLTPDGHYFYTMLNSNKVVYYDQQGNKFPLDVAVTDISEGVGIVRDAFNRFSEYHMALNGKRLSNVNYSKVFPFSEGMAIVAQKNEFGELKYGFIDRSGKQVIPLMYSIMPGNFKYGLATVQPKDDTEFSYALINKKGEIVRKITKAETALYPQNKFYTNGMMLPIFEGSFGVPFDKYFFMDSNLCQRTFNEIFSKSGIKFNEIILPDLRYLQEGIDDGKLRILRKVDNKNSKNNCGYFNLKTNKFSGFEFYNTFKFGSNYSNGTYNLIFDPIARLAYAEKWLGTDKNGQSVYRKGYINEDGLFVIVIAQKDKW